MPRSLPLRANLEWLKKLAKERLPARQAASPDAKLSEAQLEVAREFGFSSWRQLHAEVEERRAKLDAVVPPDVRRRAAAETVAADDPELAQLFAAVMAGETQQVATLVARRPSLTLARDADGQTPLHVAAEYHDPTLAAVLVAYGADLEAKLGRSAHTPLSWAITCRAIECAQTLVKLGAECDLFCAAGIGLVDEVRSFFDERGELEPNAARTGSSRYSTDGSLLPCPPPTAREQISDALYIASRNGQAEVVELLLGKDPDLSFRGYMGGTSLHWAHFSGSRRVVELLERAGADQTLRDDVLGCLPRSFGICTAANWGFAFLVRPLLAADPTLATVMDGRTSPLHEAARNNRAEVVQLLLEHGADPSQINGDGKTALDLAIAAGHTAVAELLRAGKP